MKRIYNHPSVTITDITMVQTLCASVTGGTKFGSGPDYDKTTTEQL